jgi:hypothetical protein
VVALVVGGRGFAFEELGRRDKFVFGDVGGGFVRWDRRSFH